MTEDVVHLKMAATRPGNPERGWNDPPMFMYSADGQKVQSTTRKNPLTQRVGMPQSYTSQTTGGPKPSGLLGTKSAPPLVNTAPRLQASPHAPPAGNVTSPDQSRGDQVERDDQAGKLPDDICATSIAELRGVLERCEEKLTVRVADDIKKRMGVLEAAWKAGKLSTVVQQRMAKLSKALAQREYDKAHDVHLSLMVDYVSEVSQWMVGIKRLIIEARAVLPHPPPSLPSDTKDEDGTEQATSNNQETLNDDGDQPEDTAGDRQQEQGGVILGSSLIPDSPAGEVDGLPKNDEEISSSEPLQQSETSDEQDSAQTIGTSSDQVVDSLSELSLPSATNKEEERGAESSTSQGDGGDSVVEASSGQTDQPDGIKLNTDS